MATIPSDDRQMLIFAQGHLSTWDTNKAALGLTEPEIEGLTDAIGEAQTALSAAEAARIASKGATTTFKTSSRTLRTLVADAVRSIQTRARNTSNPALYGLADIPAPQPRSESGPTPGQPGDLRVGVNSDGSLTLTWKSNNPPQCANVVYKVMRALNGATTYALIDTVGERSFTDATVPIGASSVSYIITGKRGNQTGAMSPAFTARFGSVGGGGGEGGGFTITSTETMPSAGMKMAA
ncbi:MAG TPA: fibronectin type III domain-containing protein [Phycisphaerales bacterium]|nr:fibronectin type III domain-containing protein [Phycisphaerales bacterium]